jgi:hypothetical protein
VRIAAAIGFAAVTVYLASSPSSAWAQSTAPANPIPDKSSPGGDSSNASGNLSDKLNQTGGVIHPNNGVDPAMAKPAPAAGATRVIPPPSGATGAQPK